VAGAIEVFANQPTATVTSGGGTAPASGTVETWTASSWAGFAQATTNSTQYHIYDTTTGKSTELILVQNTSGTSATVVRGAEGTTPVAHSAPFQVTQAITAGALAQLQVTDWINVVTMFGADPTGTADSTTAIQTAIGALPAHGGVIYFPAGVYSCSGALTVDQSYVTLMGDGYGFATQITVPSGTISRTAAIILGNTAPVSQCSVRDLAVVVDGGAHAVNPGTGHGIVIAGDNCLVENVIVRWCSGDDYHFGQDLLNTATQTTVASASNGQALPQATVNVASTTGFASSGQLITRKTSGACAYITYTGTTGTTFTGCSSNFGGASYTLATGDVIIPVSLQFDCTVINTYAMNYGVNGYYADWTYYSCEWLDARAIGAAAKPAATASPAQNGFLIYGGTHKFVTCHPYFCAGSGMQIGDAHTSTAQDITVIGGEWESCTSSGIYVTNNQGTVVISDGANFYGNGLSGSGEDIFLGFGSKNVRIESAVFKQSPAGLNPQNIYAFSSTYCSVDGCVFYTSGSWAVKNIYLDGASGAVSYFTIRNNRMFDANSSALAVEVKGATTNCVIQGNITDASITEVISGSTPTGNSYWDNVIVPGHSAALSLASSSSAAAPVGGFQPADVGLIAWNFDPFDAITSAISAVNGTIYLLQFILRSPATITNGGFFIASGATTATANENFIALVDSTGTIQASTAAGAIDTATQSGGWFSQPFSATYAAPAGKYYLAVLANAATPLKFGAIALQSSTGPEAGVSTAAAFRYAVNGTGATALPGSFTLSSNTHTGGIIFPVGVS
jgi:hypothetical protein